MKKYLDDINYYSSLKLERCSKSCPAGNEYSKDYNECLWECYNKLDRRYKVYWVEQRQKVEDRFKSTWFAIFILTYYSTLKKQISLIIWSTIGQSWASPSSYCTPYPCPSGSMHCVAESNSWNWTQHRTPHSRIRNIIPAHSFCQQLCCLVSGFTANGKCSTWVYCYELK